MGAVTYKCKHSPAQPMIYGENVDFAAFAPSKPKANVIPSKLVGGLAALQAELLAQVSGR